MAGKKEEKFQTTVSLKKLKHVPDRKRTDKAITLIRRQIGKSARKKPEAVKISNEVNEQIWKGKKTKYPRTLELQVLDKGYLYVYLKDSKELKKIEEEKKKKEKEGKKKEEEKGKEVKIKKDEKKEKEEKQERPAGKKEVEKTSENKEIKGKKESHKEEKKKEQKKKVEKNED